MPQKKISTQAIWVLFGSLSAFMFSIISAIILSRHFNKVDYGTYRQVVYIYDTFLVLFTLGVPRAYSYFLPRVPFNESKRLIRKIGNVLLCSGLVMGGALFVLADYISAMLNNQSLAIPLRYFSIVPVFMLPTMGVEGILATYRKARLLAFYNIFTRLLMLLIVVLPVVIFDGSVNHAALGFAGASAVIFIITLALRQHPVREAEECPTKVTYTEIMKFSAPLMIASFWGLVIKFSDQFYISRYFGAEVFAEYANGAIELPFVGMVVYAASTVLAPIYSKMAFENSADSRAEMLRLWNVTLSKTVILIYPAVAYCVCYADLIMAEMYGVDYVASGDYFQVKVAINFMTIAVYGPVMLAIGGNRYYARVHMIGALVLVVAQWLFLYVHKSPMVIVCTSVLFQAFIILSMMMYVARYFGIRLRELVPVSLMFKIFSLSFMVAYSIRFALVEYFSTFSDFQKLVATLVAFSALYLSFARVLGVKYFDAIRSLKGSKSEPNA